MNVKNVLFMRKTGQPLVMFDFTSQDVIVDESLISGFLSAIDGFSAEVFDKDTDAFVVDHGRDTLSVFKQGELMLAVMSEESVLHLKQGLLDTLDYFNDRVGSLLAPGEMGRGAEVRFEALRRKIIRVLFRVPVAEDWVVKPIDYAPNYAQCLSECELLGEFDGQRRIIELPSFTSSAREETYEVINYLHYQGVVRFKDHVEPRDYIAGKEHLREILTTKSGAYQHITQEHPSVDLVRLVQRLDTIRLVKEIANEQGSEVVFVLMWLFDKDYITILDEYQRRLVMVIDVVNNIVKVLQHLGKYDKIKPDIQAALKSVSMPEIEVAIHFNDKEKEIVVARDKHLTRLVGNEISRLTRGWLDLATALIEQMYPVFKKKLVQELHDLLVVRSMDLVHPSDLDLLDPLLLVLERLQA